MFHIHFWFWLVQLIILTWVLFPSCVLLWCSLWVCSYIFSVALFVIILTFLFFSSFFHPLCVLFVLLCYSYIYWCIDFCWDIFATVSLIVVIFILTFICFWTLWTSSDIYLLILQHSIQLGESVIRIGII